uniref:WsbL n=1 Tax=Anoxybacteroides tepidamans TaxID=265948 RepID=A2BD28_9BACL|nr:WsbL [Anoxybacillus tepidamans]
MIEGLWKWLKSGCHLQRVLFDGCRKSEQMFKRSFNGSTNTQNKQSTGCASDCKSLIQLIYDL